VERLAQLGFQALDHERRTPAGEVICDGEPQNKRGAKTGGYGALDGLCAAEIHCDSDLRAAVHGLAQQSARAGRRFPPEERNAR
jgi:hypothetical protein